ncbi:MAG: SIS domain-containing protein [Sphingomonadaceae bacterium]|nr:SIS domain-containing protein [Sphingomonadaceae bacterium]
MKTFAYDEQLASMPDVVAEVIARTDIPSLEPERPILFTGIGTSLHAARVAADWVVQLTGGRVRALGIDAHDLGTGVFPIHAQDQVVVISHRGKKIYPLASLDRARAAGCRTISIVGDAAPEQSADHTIRTCANETAGTFSVSYLASLAALARIVAATFPDEAEAFAAALPKLSGAVAASLAMKPQLELVRAFSNTSPILISGFGPDLATAQEAALKIKEGAWLWTEAMSPEFAIHGTPASYHPGMSAIVMLPEREDGGRSRLLIDVLKRLDLSTVATCGTDGADLIFSQPPHPLLRPFLSILPFHLLTSALAHTLATDPDTLHGHRQPWKSVMAELRL